MIDDTGDVYERTVDDDGTVSVPEKHAAQQACVFDTASGMVLEYAQVGADGTVTGFDAGREVTVVIPSDGQMESHS